LGGKTSQIGNEKINKATKGRGLLGKNGPIMRERILRSPHVDVEVMEVIKTKQYFQIYIVFLLKI